MQPNHKKKLIALALLIAILGSLYLFWLKPKFFLNLPDSPSASIIEVNVINVKKQKIQLFLELPGRVTAHRISEVRPQVSGILKKRMFTEGSFVKRGKQLYQIDSSTYEAAYRKAKQNLKAIQAKKDRYKKLLELDAISSQEYDDVLASLAQSQSDFKAAKASFEYSKVYAPISGYIGKSNVSEGALLTANQSEALTTITELDPVYVDMSQSSKDAVKIGNQKNIPVSLKVDDVAYDSIGKLKLSEVFVDESTDSVRLRALFPNRQKKLLPGMFVSAKLHLEPFEAITVPQRAASRAQDGLLIVWVIDENNFAKVRKIKADQIFEDQWIVQDGLSEGDVVIYDGFQKITDGTKVKPISK